jgi:hypothetical protein
MDARQGAVAAAREAATASGAGRAALISTSAGYCERFNARGREIEDPEDREVQPTGIDEIPVG